MNIADIVIILIVALLVFLALRSIIKRKKSGNACSCGCGGCTKNCTEKH